MRRVWEAGLSIALVFLMMTTPVAGVVELQNNHSPSTQNTANTLQTSSAQITATEAEGGAYSPGETVPVDFTVENTGDTSEEFYVDVSLQRPNGNWVTGEGRSVLLSPGESISLTLGVKIPDDATEGSYGAGSGVFQTSAKDELHDYGQDLDSFTVESPSTDADVTSTYAESGTYQPGDSVPVDVTVENTGDTTHDFYVDASVQRPDGGWVTGEATTVYLSPGETETITLNGEIPDDAEEGTWSAGSGVFHSSAKDDRYDYGQDLDSFTVESPSTDADVTSTYAESGTYQPGESVPVEVTVENTGDTTHDFYVDSSVQRPDGGWVTGEATTVYLSPGETETVTLYGEIPDYAEEGTWSAGSGIFHSSAKDDRYDYGQDLDSFEVTGANEAPTIDRESPSGDVSVTVSDSVEFQVDGEDPDGNLEDVEWYINGDYIQTQSIDGSVDTATWSHEFDQSGTYTVEAVVFDSENADSQSVRWDVTVEQPDETNARITQTLADSGNYSPGDRVPIETTVENTGNTEHDFYVDASVQRPDGGWVTGEATTVYLSPGETETVTLYGEIPDDAEEGTWSAGSGIFHSSAKDDRYDYGQDLDSFEVTGANEAPTIDRESPSGDVSVTVSDSVEFQVDGEDPDGNLEDVEWYINGDYIQTQSIDGSVDTATWSHEFDQSGTYTVEAVVLDTENADSQSVEWDVTVEQPDETSARVTQTLADSDTYRPGDRVPVEITVENTGNTEHNFYVDASVQRPDGGWVTGEATTVYLSPGETETITLNGEIPDDAEEGTWSAGSGVFHSSAKDDRYDYGQDADSFEVTGANEQPSADRESPSGDQSVTVGDSVEFQVGAEDPDRNLAGVEWYIDDAAVSESDISGSDDTATWETTFDDSGTYHITAAVFDTEQTYSDEVTWTVSVTESASAEIRTVEPPEGAYGAGNDAQTSVTVENTGRTSNDFFVGYSVRGPNGDWYDTLGLTGREITLNSNEQKEVSLSWRVPPEAPTGDYDVKVAVWRGTDRQSLTNLADERVITDAFEKPSNVDARVDDISVESKTTKVDSSTTVVARISNTGYIDHKFDIRITGIGPDGNRYPNLFTHPEAIEKSTTDRVEQGWYVPNIAKKGVYDIQVEVIDSSNDNKVVSSEMLEDAIQVGESESDNIEIRSTSQVTGVYDIGDTISAQADIQNTGDNQERYYVRYQARTDGGDWKNKARSIVTLPPGETDTAYLSWFTDDDTTGTYETRIVVQTRDATTVGKNTFSDDIEIKSTSKPPEGYDLTIVTTGTDGEPLDRAVTVSGARTYDMRTGNDGKLTITGLYESSPGRLPEASIYVNEPGSLAPTTRDIVLSRGGTTTEFSFSESTTIEGEVYRDDGPVIDDATVEIRGQQAVTNADGRFVMDEKYSIPSDQSHIDATVTVKRDGEVLKRTEKEIEPGENDIGVVLYGEPPIDLEEAETGFFSGRIAFEDNPRKHSNPGFLLGWIASGIAVFGDVRDAGDAVNDRDWSDAGITLLGLAPEIGDAAKTSKIISRVSRYWTASRSTLVKFAAKTTKVPSKAVKRIDAAYPALNPGSVLTTRYGLSDSVVQQLAKNGAPMDRATSRVEVIKNHGNGRVSDIAERVRSGGTLKSESIKAATTGLRDEHGISKSGINTIRTDYNPVIIEDGFSQLDRWREGASLTSRTNTGNIVGDVTEALALRQVKGLHPSATVVSDLRGKSPGLYLRQGLGVGSGDFDYVLVRVTENGEYEVKRIYEVSAEQPSEYKQSEQIRNQLSDLRKGNRQINSRVLDADDFDDVDPSSDHYTIGPREYHSSSPKYDNGYDYAVRYNRDEIQDISEAYKKHKIDAEPASQLPTNPQSSQLKPASGTTNPTIGITKPVTVP
ncbi:MULTISPECIES: Ig-like domain-containing protein [Haloarcula]|uniref:Ig-like domain-containing protein n=1 Tax=Haloarcula TaxID=2237 RepID=UPI000F8D395D|nr:MULTISPECIES: hypothetical protein [Haloarcula]NHX41643.1 hypothetical protein [Haloarcula sp. R1-2]